jgi:hypothetical protein
LFNDILQIWDYSLHKECVALELLAKYCGSGENGTKAENHVHTTHTENKETTEVDDTAAITEEEDATTKAAKEALPHRIVVQLQQSSYVELTKFVQRTSKEQLLLTRSANDVRNQAPMNKALVALMTRMVLSVREYATHLLVAKVTSVDRARKWANITFYNTTTTTTTTDNTTTTTTDNSVSGQVDHTFEYYFFLSLVRRACWRPSARVQLLRMVKKLVGTSLHNSSERHLMFRLQLVLALRTAVLETLYVKYL